MAVQRHVAWACRMKSGKLVPPILMERRQVMFRVWMLMMLALMVNPVYAVTHAIYVQSNASQMNEIAWLLQDTKTGKLAFKGSRETGGNGDPAINGNQAHAIASDGRYLFVANAGDDSISVFRILKAGQPVFTGKFASLGRHPVSLAVNHHRLLVVNQGDQMIDGATSSIQSFRISASGSLSPLKGRYTYLSSFVPVDITTTPSSGFFAVALNGIDQIDFFSLLPSGVMARMNSITGIHNPLGGAMGRLNNSRLAFTLAGDDQPGVVSIGMKGLAPETVIQDVRPDLLDPCWAAAQSGGKYLWTSAFKTRALTLYRWEARGSLSYLGVSIPDVEGPGGLDVTLSDDDRYLFRLRGDNVEDDTIPTRPLVDVFRVSIAGKREGAGLSMLDQTALPESWADAKATGLVAVSVKP